MAPKVYRAADVCEIAQLQPYVLRSWEKEFPGIGVQKSDDSPRLYRQADLDQVLHIKQLVFGEGLTLAGARRRIEETTPKTAAEADDEVAEVLDALASDARTRIAHVRDGLKSILRLVSSAPGTVVVVDDYRLEPPGFKPEKRKPPLALAPRPTVRARAKPVRVAAKKASKSKRGRASA